VSSRDYIVKQIEQMTAMLSVVLGLKREQKPQHAETTIDEFLKRSYGLSLRLIRSLSEQDLVRMCDTGDLGGREKLFTFAMILKEDSELREQQDDQPAEIYSQRLKALRMFLHYDETDHEWTASGPALAGEPIAELLDLLQEYELPMDDSLRIWRYHERHGAFASAEDALFDALERLQPDLAAAGEPALADVLAEAEAFYARLLALSDERLLAGNLPRGEIPGALAAIARMRADSGAGADAPPIEAAT